jgi:hypothetical protein
MHVHCMDFCLSYLASCNDMRLEQHCKVKVTGMLAVSALNIFQFYLHETWDLKNVVFWDVALCRTWVDRRFGGTYRLHLQASNRTTWDYQLGTRGLQLTAHLCLVPRSRMVELYFTFYLFCLNECVTY